MNRRRRGPLLAGAAMLLMLSGCALPPASQPGADEAPTSTHAAPAKAEHRPSAATRSVAPAARGGTALQQLATLPVKGRAPLTGYDRDRFGAAWLDTDRNGCDTRNDILRRDLTQRAYDPDTHGCVVVSGVLQDPYTRTRIHFVKGDGDLVDIDHVVALGNAWVTGAFRWEIRKRAALANDPMNLLAVDASANRQKGDGDAATWLPGNKGFRCAYVARQIGVKAKYGLWVTAPEHDAMERALSSCPSQHAVPDSGAPVMAPLHLSEPSASSTGGGSAATRPQGGSGPYANCTEARAAGAAPLHRGDPGYSADMDGDGDGVACE